MEVKNVPSGLQAAPFTLLGFIIICVSFQIFFRCAAIAHSTKRRLPYATRVSSSGTIRVIDSGRTVIPNNFLVSGRRLLDTSSRDRNWQWYRTGCDRRCIHHHRYRQNLASSLFAKVIMLKLGSCFICIYVLPEKV